MSCSLFTIGITELPIDPGAAGDGEEAVTGSSAIGNPRIRERGDEVLIFEGFRGFGMARELKEGDDGREVGVFGIGVLLND